MVAGNTINVKTTAGSNGALTLSSGTWWEIFNIANAVAISVDGSGSIEGMDRSIVTILPYGRVPGIYPDFQGLTSVLMLRWCSSTRPVKSTSMTAGLPF